MLLRISHETKLTYTSPVADTVFEVRMAPPTDEDQTNLGYRLRITPQAPVTSYRDGMGNRVDLFNVAKPYVELLILATSYVRTHRRPGPVRLEGVERLGEGEVGIDAIELLAHSPLVDRSPALEEFVASLPRPAEATSVIGFLEALMQAVSDRLKFEPKVTQVRTPVSEALELGRGVCQDFSHLFIAACRGLGIPARYVSGYVNQTGEMATHAWCQVWAGDRVGWVDLDPTTRRFCADDHIAVAFGRDYSDVPPNRGLYTEVTTIGGVGKGRAVETIAVTVKVESVDRVPMEWNEWSVPTSRPNSFQTQRMGGMSQSQKGGRSPYPNQRSFHAGLHQQQGEQQ